MFHLILMPLLTAAILFAIVIRIIMAPFRTGRWYRRRGWCRNGWGGDGYRNPYAPGLFTILALVALERIFGRRYY